MKTNKEILESIKNQKKQAQKKIAFIGIAIGVGLVITGLVGLFIGTYPNMEVQIPAQTTAFFLLGKNIGHKYYAAKRWLRGE